MLDWKTWAISLAAFCGITFALCVVWCGLAPEGWHVRALFELALPGFVWLTPASFLLGLVETTLTGAYAGALFAVLHNVAFRLSTSAAKRDEIPVVA